MIVSLFLISVLAGFIFYSQQNKMTALALGQARRGTAAVLAVHFGSLAGEGLWAAVAVAVLAYAAQFETLRTILSIVGSFFFIRLAWSALQDARQGVTPQVTAATGGADFGAGARMSLSNPYALGFWFGVSAAVVFLATPAPGFVDFIAYFAGVVAGAAIWCLLVGYVPARRQDQQATSFFRTVNLFCGVVAALIGIVVLWSAISQPVLAPGTAASWHNVSG